MRLAANGWLAVLRSSAESQQGRTSNKRSMQNQSKIDEKSTKNRRKIDLGPFRASTAFSGTHPDALRTAFGHPNASLKLILGHPRCAKSGQKSPKSVPRALRRRSKSFWGHSQDTRKRRSHRPTQLEAFADRFFKVFGRRAAAPKCISYRSCQCVIDVGRFARQTLAARKKNRKNSRFGLQNRSPGRPGDPRASKFERRNGQVERKSASEVLAGPR